jgi:signal transducing adaptor molecule
VVAWSLQWQNRGELLAIPPSKDETADFQIFPVTYVEALAEPTARELQDEAQEEARVFASLGQFYFLLRRKQWADFAGLVDQLLQTLKSIDPARGDRLDDRPEVEQMYQASVGLQGQINALIKKYSDQKGQSN